MADTGNGFGDVYGFLPPLASNVGNTNMTLALADQTRRTVSTAFQSAIFLREDDTTPLHFATGYVLPYGNASDLTERPIFSIPKWNDDGWGIVLPPPPEHGYMYFRDRPEKVYLDRSSGKLWKLLYRWRAPGEMLLISAHSPDDPTPPGHHVAFMSEDPETRDLPPRPPDDDLPSEAAFIQSLAWTPVVCNAPTDADHQSATVDSIGSILASMADPSSPTTTTMPSPDTTCPAALALLRGQVNDNLCAAVSLSHPGIQIQSAEDFHTRFGHLPKKYMRWFMQHHPGAFRDGVKPTDCLCDLCFFIRRHRTRIHSKSQHVYELAPHPVGEAWCFDFTRYYRGDYQGIKVGLIGCCRASGFYVFYPLHSKTTAFNAFRSHIQFLRSRGMVMRKLVFDCDSILFTYANPDSYTKDMAAFMSDAGIRVQFTAPHQHWLSFLERSFKPVALQTNRNLISGHVTDIVWADATTHAVDLLNISPVFAGDEHMILKQARCVSFGYQPNPLSQLPFAAIVTTMEPGVKSNQFVPTSKVGILLRNPSTTWTGFKVLRATCPWQVVQRLFVSYSPQRNILPTSLAPFLDLRADRLPSEALDDPATLARTDFTAFFRRVFGVTDLDETTGTVKFNSFGNVTEY